MDKKHYAFFIIAFIIFGGIVGILLFSKQPDKRPEYYQDNGFQKGVMKITSSAFEHEQSIPSRYTCDGRNISPPIHIVDIPDGAKSLLLIVDDPDAPRGTWVHWTVWNIDPATTDIAESSVPKNGIEGMTSFGKPGYGGPCPPSGTHRYFFKMYALDALLPTLESSMGKEDFLRAMTGHILAQTEMIGLYKR